MDATAFSSFSRTKLQRTKVEYRCSINLIDARLNLIGLDFPTSGYRFRNVYLLKIENPRYEDTLNPYLQILVMIVVENLYKSMNNDRSSTHRKIVITGGGGYVGSLLSRILLENGHEVTILDRFLFGRTSIQSLEYFYPDSLTVVEGDIRKPELVASVLKDTDSLVHLAAIVGDPACSVRADETVETNYNATTTLANLADDAGVTQMIFSSTCSVYGSNDDWLDETSPTSPISLYGQTKLNAENYLMNTEFENLEITILRLGTVFGLSPRMRFDLVVNYLTMKAIMDKQIKILGGKQWRPFVHVADAATAMSKVVQLNGWKSVSGNIINIGSNAGNTMIEGLIPIYQEAFPDIEIKKEPSTVDARSYRVRFSRLKEYTGFEPSLTIADGIKEIIQAFLNGTIVDPERKEYYNYRVWT